MARPAKFTPDEVIAAIRASRGLVTHAADLLDCDPQTVRNYIGRSARVAAAFDEERERVLDLGESKLFTAVSNDEAWAIAYLLSTIGKHRGYVKRDEITGKDGAAHKVILGWGDDGE